MDHGTKMYDGSYMSHPSLRMFGIIFFLFGEWTSILTFHMREFFPFPLLNEWAFFNPAPPSFLNDVGQSTQHLVIVPSSSSRNSHGVYLLPPFPPTPRLFVHSLHLTSWHEIWAIIKGFMICNIILLVVLKSWVSQEERREHCQLMNKGILRLSVV